MNHHAAVDTMFLVGGIMVAAPLLFFGTVIGIWWYLRKKQTRESDKAIKGDVGR